MTNDFGKLMSERMTTAERDTSFPDSEPRDAATLMLIDRSGPKPKFLLGRRHAGHKFMPGKFVFPGGRIEPLDHKMTAVSELHPDALGKLMERVAEPSVEFARAFPLAAVRETAEETGLLLGVKRDQPPQVPGEIWDEFAKANVHPDLGQIHFIARAITPPRRPRRFDTRFLTADASAIAHTIEGVVGPEFRASRAHLGSDRGSDAARHADHHRRRARGAAGARRGRHGARPAGALLFHGRPEIPPGTAVNAEKQRVS